MINKRIMVFVKRIISLPILFLIGCGITEPGPDVIIEPYCNMPVIDGMPTLTLKDTWQTIHMIDFEVTVDGEPEEYASLSFESNLFWQLNDTLGYFTHQWLTDEIEYNTYDTSYVIGGGLHDLVPTSNYRSLTDDEGLTRNAIAPVRTMAGDTLILSYSAYIQGVGRHSGELKVKLVR